MFEVNSRFGTFGYGINNIYKKVFEAPGVNFNAKDRRLGQTLIHYCLTLLSSIKPSIINIEVFKLFTQYRGINWNIPDDDGKMPIHIATELAVRGCYDFDIDILKILLSVQSIDVNVKDSQNKNIANYVVDREYCGNCESIDIDTDGPLCSNSCYARSGEERLRVLKLLSQNERINWNNKNCLGNTPLMQALEYGDTEAIKILLTIPSVDVTVLENMPMTPVMLQCIQHLRNVTNISIFIPECPVCYDQFQRGHPIYQCDTGHFVCGSCYERVNSCPVCRGDMMGRCTDFEKFLENNANNI